MNAEQYRLLAAAASEHPRLVLLLTRINKALTALGYVTYPLLLVLLWLLRPAFLLRAILVPGFSFVLLTLVRPLFGKPRPYEVYGFTPLLGRTGKGRSFPSRHTFCLVLIAMTWLMFFPPAGVLLLVLGLLLGAVRVLGGVHFLPDVLAGALAAVFTALLGYVWIP